MVSNITRGVCFIVVACLFSQTAQSQSIDKIPTANDPYTIQTEFSAPAPSTDPLVSFDWDGNGDLYFTTGDGNFGARMNSFRFDGNTITPIVPELAKFVGARLTNVRGFIFFTENGDFDTFTDLDVYRYDPLGVDDAMNVGRGGVVSLYGIATRTGNEIFSSAGFPASIFYTGVEETGAFTQTDWINIANIGESSGPVAFDPWGNMYYVHGFATEAKIFRFTAAEVDAAIAAKGTEPLSGEGHEWADVEGYSGGTGAACDAAGNLIITATSFGIPSTLRMFHVGCDGTNVGTTDIATDPDRLETVRFGEGDLFFSSGQGIFRIDLPPSVVAVTALGNPTSESPSIDVEIAFTEAVSGINPDGTDFELVYGGYAEGPNPPTINTESIQIVDDRTVALTIDSGIFRGELGLRVKSSGAIVDAVAAPLDGDYESCTLVSLTTAESNDVNADGETNAIDIAFVVGELLGIIIDGAPGDANGDGKVNASDLQFVINAVLEG